MKRLPLPRPPPCLRPRRHNGPSGKAPLRVVVGASAIPSRRPCGPSGPVPAMAIRRLSGSSSPDETLRSFANLDHGRSDRAGFPEAVFGQGKTPGQLRSILQSMTDDVNGRIESAREDGATTVSEISTAIIATRVDRDAYDAVVSEGPLEGGTAEYHETARIISVRADAVEDSRDVVEPSSGRPSVVVACAGTTDLPVAEEAALTLSLCGIRVERVYDCGVAGLHRIIGALPRLRDPGVGCVIVCAGMDGALPSVVGGLVDVPTVACPTSVGYGASFGGVAGLLTMLNSCR